MMRPLAIALLAACGGAPAPAAPHQAAQTCKPVGATTPVDAVAWCWNHQIRPALATLAASPDLATYHLGARAYLEHVLTIAPVIAIDPVTRNDPPDPTTTVLGSGATPAHAATITLTLREPGMPADGDFELDFVVDTSTLEVVRVWRILGG